VCLEQGSPDVSVRRLDVGQPADARGVHRIGSRTSDPHRCARQQRRAGWMGAAPDAGRKIEELSHQLQRRDRTMQAALPSMLARRSGVIISVASVVGFGPSPYSAVLLATQACRGRPVPRLRGELSEQG